MSRTCATCGRACDDDASFCQRCGSPLSAVTGRQAPGEAARPRAAPSATTPPGSPPPGSTRKGKPAPRWLVVLVVAAVAALAGVMAFAFFPRGGREGAGGDAESPGATGGGAVTRTPAPVLSEYLAGAVGPNADRLAAILSDGAVRPVARFSGQQLRQLAYSPEGEWLACIAGTYKRSELWLFNTATGDARQATAHTPGVVAVDSVAWLSETQLLLAGYTETPTAPGQNARFLVFDTRSEDVAPLTGEGVELQGVSVSASDDGGTVAFVTYTDATTNSDGAVTAMERLQVLDRPSGDVSELGDNEAYFDVDARAFDEPLISPAGQAVIYRRAGSDVSTSYTVVGTDGTVLMPEKEALMPAGYAWDPEGTKVVFTGQAPSSSGDEAPVIFWQFDTLTGGAPTVLAKYADTVVQDLAWSPDGTTIAWAAYDEKKDWHTGDIHLMPATGGESATLVERALSPAWAPGAAEPLQTSPSP
jgi:Tol biopolymer transport system component